jgi:hypothetical protein
VRPLTGLAGLAAIGTQGLIALGISLLPLAPVGATSVTASPRFLFGIFAELAAGTVIGLVFPTVFASVALFLAPTVLAGSVALALAMPGEDGPGNPFSLLGAAFLALVILALFFLGYGAGYTVRSCLRRLRKPRPPNPLAIDRIDT